MRNIASIFSALKTAYIHRSDPEGVQLLARTYWRVMLSLSLIAIVVSLGLGGYQLWKVFGTFNQKQASEALLSITVNRATLQKLLDGFDMRRKHFETLPNATTTYPDPSH